MKGRYVRPGILCLIIVLCAYLDSHAQYEHLLHKTFGERAAFMGKIVNGKIINPSLDSAEAFSEVRPIAELAASRGDKDLLLECKLIYSLYYFVHNDPVTIPFLETLRSEAVNDGKRWAEARIEDIEAQFYYNTHQYEKSFEHFLRMYEVTKSLEPDEVPGRLAAFCMFANALYKFREYRAAIFYLKEGLRDSLKYPIDIYSINAINTVGLCYRQLGMIDSSSFYFRNALQKAIREKFEPWIGIASGNLGENYFMQGRYAEAKPLVQTDADLALKFQDFGLASNALMIQAEINMKEGNSKKAGEQLALARECAYRSRQYSRLKKLYPILSRFYSATGNPALASSFLDSALNVRDSLEREFSALYMTRAQQKVEGEKNKAKLEELDHRQKISTIQRNALIAIIILASILAFFIYDRQRRRYKAKQVELKRANEDLALASRELNAFTRSVSEKNQMIELLQSQIGSVDSEAVAQLQRSTILTDEQWVEFRDLFDKVHHGFLNRLKEKMPGLTPAETRFVALSKLKLNNKEMASTLGVGTDAIRQYRSRLRKKFGLQEEEHLEELFEQV